MPFDPDKYLTGKSTEAPKSTQELTVHQEPSSDSSFDPVSYIEAVSTVPVDRAGIATAAPKEPEAPESPGLMDILSYFVSNPKEIPGAAGAAAKVVGKEAVSLGKGAVEHPMQTARGVRAGIEKATPSVLKPIGELNEWLTGREQPDYEPKTEQEKKTAGVTEFTNRMLQGLALQSALPVPGAAAGAGKQALTLLGKGALANVPFVEKAFKEGGIKEASKEVALNTVIDAALLGGSKLLKAIGKGPAQKASEAAVSETVRILGGRGKGTESMLNRLPDSITQAIETAAQYSDQLPKAKNADEALKSISIMSDNLTSAMSSYHKDVAKLDPLDLKGALDDALKQTWDTQAAKAGGSAAEGVVSKMSKDLYSISESGVVDLGTAMNLRSMAARTSAVSKDPFTQTAYGTFAENIDQILKTEAGKDVELIWMEDAMQQLLKAETTLAAGFPEAVAKASSKGFMPTVLGAAGGAVAAPEGKRGQGAAVGALGGAGIAGPGMGIARRLLRRF